MDSIASNETMLNTINDPLITHFAVGYNSSDENKTYTVAFFSMSGYYKVKVVSDKGNCLQAIKISIDKDDEQMSETTYTKKNGLAVL